MLVFGGSLATASQEHALVAVLNGSVVSIYEIPSGQEPQRPQYAHSSHQIPLDTTFATKVKCISFSPKSPHCEPRILLASTTTVHVYSALSEAQPFHASITNAASPSVALQSASFLTPYDVLLIPELAPRITIRNIITGLGVELRDVKHTNALTTASTNKICSYSIRKSSGHIAFLTRPAVGKDIVVLFRPPDLSKGNGDSGWQIEAELAILTSDALGLSFSPDGHWLAFWDTASAVTSHESYDVYIYTSTGKFYRSWKSSDVTGDKELGLGVKAVDWLFDGRLAIGTADGRVIILAAGIFEEQASISHPNIFEQAPEAAGIYVEQIAPENGTRSYASATLPAAPPGQVTTVGELSPLGVTVMAVSTDGALLASVCAETPTTVHITSLNQSRIATRAILIHHSPIKVVQWHPVKPEWLLIRTSQDRSPDTDRLYTWSDNLPEPMIINALIPEAVTKATSSKTSSTPSAGTPTASWVIPPSSAHPDAIPDILFTFPNAALCISALPAENPESEENTILLPLNDDDTPTRPPAPSAHKLTQKTPIRGHGPEDAFDASFEQLRAESDLAQSVSESVASVTDGGFSPVKFDATDWTRRQVLGETGGDQDDTFVGKGKR